MGVSGRRARRRGSAVLRWVLRWVLRGLAGAGEARRGGGRLQAAVGRWAATAAAAAAAGLVELAGEAAGCKSPATSYKLQDARCRMQDAASPAGEVGNVRSWCGGASPYTDDRRQTTDDTIAWPPGQGGRAPMRLRPSVDVH